ncbi:MAG: hypothetical protein QHH06_04655 [Clostridiales bacterium]|jgi:hypothetical protein|nr:hypothetical protein [Eubacteriales bacterium]MDH7565758.1 hypothetical protein [Clostridiales bacterium]
MLKKLTALLLTVSILVAGTAVFAEGTAAADTKAKIAGKLQEFKQNAPDIKPLFDTIRSNRTQLQQLRADAKTAYQSAKTKIKELLKNKDNT